MVQRSVEDRLIELEAKYFAHSNALRALVLAVCNTDAKRKVRRDAICDGLESAYSQPGVSAQAHEVLQRAVHEVEALFAAPSPKPSAATPRTGQPPKVRRKPPRD